jgi:hypothetical protein
MEAWLIGTQHAHYAGRWLHVLALEQLQAFNKPGTPNSKVPELPANRLVVSCISLHPVSQSHLPSDMAYQLPALVELTPASSRHQNATMITDPGLEELGRGDRAEKDVRRCVLFPVIG